ncbi:MULTISPECIES: GNAT family N-acetyltransferase [Rhodobacterales]|uniref:GNAT family N-acetyltransferase n=1 Tax=Roseobacter sp. N2S TaxID=2663844 RepID=UPI0028548950|nr:MULTISPECIES: GNAT family N-acetyltransferase [Rhodobacterales]MDR6264433.1 GNAT superfamily N-acetyltransferase [Roseobacter sp. N2S]
MTAIVRYVTAADEPVWRELWADYLAFYETTREEDVYAESWRRILDPDVGMFAMVAETPENGVVGIVNFLYHTSFWEKENRIYLNDLYVRPEIRGTGAGKAMIDAVETHAKQHNCSQVWWMTANDNAVARKLYDGVAKLAPFVKYQII